MEQNETEARRKKKKERWMVCSLRRLVGVAFEADELLAPRLKSSEKRIEKKSRMKRRSERAFGRRR
jgi:hypothetical protein